MQRSWKHAIGAALMLAMGAVPGLACSQEAGAAKQALAGEQQSVDIKAGDPAKGKLIYSRCGACHSITYNRTGTMHCGLFGRKAGSVPGYDYSQAMQQSGIIWNAKTLNKFLTNPMQYVPGTKMGYAGISDRQERADLITYLKIATDPKKCADQ